MDLIERNIALSRPDAVEEIVEAAKAAAWDYKENTRGYRNKSWRKVELDFLEARETAHLNCSHNFERCIIRSWWTATKCWPRKQQRSNSPCPTLWGKLLAKLRIVSQQLRKLTRFSKDGRVARTGHHEGLSRTMVPTADFVEAAPHVLKAGRFLSNERICEVFESTTDEWTIRATTNYCGWLYVASKERSQQVEVY